MTDQGAHRTESDHHYNFEKKIVRALTRMSILMKLRVQLNVFVHAHARFCPNINGKSENNLDL